MGGSRPLPISGRLLLPVEQQSVWHGDMAEVIGKYQVDVRTLDDLLREVPSVDLLKLDVQGFERQVIAGGAITLKGTCCLLVEFDFERLYEGDTTYRELANIVEGELGFGFWDMSAPERRHGRALWADACFVRPGSVAETKISK